MGSLIYNIQERYEYSINKLEYHNNRIYAISNNYLTISNSEITDWEKNINISSNSPTLISFNGLLYVTNIYSVTEYNYDLWKLNDTEDGLDLVCYGNDTGYKAKKFIVYQNNLFAILFGNNGRLVKYNGTSWDIVGEISDNLTDGIIFNDNLCVSSNTGQLYVWDGTNNLDFWGSICPEGINCLCVHNGYIYGGTTEGKLYKFNHDTENWVLACDSITNSKVSELVSYRNYIYGGIAGYSEKSLLVRANLDTSSWEDLIPTKDDFFYGNICFLLLNNKLYLGTDSSPSLYSYSSFSNNIDFEADKMYDLAPAVVSFTSTVQCDFSYSYLWDFEDGTFSNEENPTHTFIRGCYDVTLILDDGEEVVTIKKENYIDAYSTEIIQIDSIEKLQLIGSPGDALSGTLGYSLRDSYVQTSNIDATNTMYWNGGNGFIPIGAIEYPNTIYSTFCGKYDGNGYSIYNLQISLNNNYYYGIGIFGLIGGAEVENLNLVNISINVDSSYGDASVGTLIGRHLGDEECIINNINVQGIIRGPNIGGIGGSFERVKINNCSSEVDISCINYAGGIIGNINFESTVENCTSTGMIEGQGFNIGGIVGNCFYTEIINCTSSVNIIANEYIGGIVGNANYSSINNCLCYSENITGSYMVGGIVGYIYNYDMGYITNCTFSGNINTSGSYLSNIGGIVGWGSFLELTDCLSTGNITIQSEGYNSVGGICGRGYINKISYCISTMLISNDYYIFQLGGIVGYLGWNFLEFTELSNCSYNGNLKGNIVGGIVGDFDISNSTISNCSSRGEIESNVIGGGIIGDCSDTVTIINSTFEGNVVSSLYEYSYYLSFFVGYSHSLTSIKNSFAMGTILCRNSSDCLGGFFGYGNNFFIENSYVLGDIYLDYGYCNYIGGLIGYGFLGKIKNSFYKGSILCMAEKEIETCLGGLIGYCFDTSVEKCYALGSIITTVERVGGLIGEYNSYGENNETFVKESFNLMNIQGDGGIIGGIIGVSKAKVKDCYNRGDIVCFKDNERNNILGGLIGKMYGPGEVYSSYSASMVRLIE